MGSLLSREAKTVTIIVIHNGQPRPCTVDNTLAEQWRCLRDLHLDVVATCVCHGRLRVAICRVGVALVSAEIGSGDDVGRCVEALLLLADDEGYLDSAKRGAR